jgi:DNA-binding MarR family transcriptional regulator
MIAATQAQFGVLTAMWKHHLRTGVMPTLQELAESSGRCKTTIHGHIAELARRGYLHRMVSMARAERAWEFTADARALLMDRSALAILTALYEQCDKQPDDALVWLQQALEDAQPLVEAQR